ncbi:MAG: TonB-dependent receptor domain-containing protein, partial [Terriglobia bacterium]
MFFIPGQQMGVITFRSPAITLFGGGEGYPRRFGHNVWQLGDDLTVSRGSHTFKMGMLYERTQSNATVSRQYGGQYYFQGLQSFLTATPVEFQGDIPASDNLRGWRQNLFGFYFQDDFQVRSNLTLNLGLRYEFTTIPTEVIGKLANFPNYLTDTAPKVGDPWFEGSYKDFAPRVGLSWDPWGNGKTAIRAGFGMYFDHLVAQPLNRAMTRIAPFSQTVRLTGTAAQFPRVDPSRLVEPPLTALVNYALQNKMFDPTKIGYSFSIQQEIMPQMVLNAAYAGSHSYHQLVGSNGNNAFPQILEDGTKFFPCRIALLPGQVCPAASFPFRRNPALGQLQFLITP